MFFFQNQSLSLHLNFVSVHSPTNFPCYDVLQGNLLRWVFYFFLDLCFLCRQCAWVFFADRFCLSDYFSFFPWPYENVVYDCHTEFFFSFLICYQFRQRIFLPDWCVVPVFSTMFLVSLSLLSEIEIHNFWFNIRCTVILLAIVSGLDLVFLFFRHEWFFHLF